VRRAPQTDAEMVAHALEMDEALLPFAAELLADFTELGGDAGPIVELLRGAGLPEDARVLDLGCGKGAIAMEIASELGFRVHGVELFAPFVEEARRVAAGAGLEGVTFEEQSITRLRPDDADAVVLAALGDVLGRPDETVRAIRRLVRPGGVLVISDGYLRDPARARPPAYAEYEGRDETRALLEAHGDRIEAELVEDEDFEGSAKRPRSEGAERDRGHRSPDPLRHGRGHAATSKDFGAAAEVAQLRARAEALAEQHPAQAEALHAFVEDQAREYAFLESDFVSVTWRIRRTSTPSASATR